MRLLARSADKDTRIALILSAMAVFGRFATDTPLAAIIFANEQVTGNVAALHPLQRLGQAADIAALAAFLLSPQASWITGQSMAVDGGRSTLRTRG